MALSQVELLEYVDRGIVRSAVDGDARGFDKDVLDNLVLHTPPVVWEALLKEVKMPVDRAADGRVGNSSSPGTRKEIWMITRAQGFQAAIWTS